MHVKKQRLNCRKRKNTGQSITLDTTPRASSCGTVLHVKAPDSELRLTQL